MSNYSLYLSISILASASIGPSVLLAASNAINFGRKKAFAGVLGHVCSVLMLALISASGLGMILLTSEFAFSIIKYIGAAYLVYIGISIFRRKGQWSQQKNQQMPPQKRSLFKQSFIMGISNPKGLVFFSALFPQFIQIEQPIIPQFILFAGTSIGNAFLFTLLYVLIAFASRDYFLRAINQNWLSRLTGSLFIGFAGVLASS